MPAAKPSSLINRHETAAETAERISQESALRPTRDLPVNPPATLRGRKTAEVVWRRLIRMFGDVEGEIVTRLDMDLLVDYCLLAEQVAELDEMRKKAMEIYELLKIAMAEARNEHDVMLARSISKDIINSFESIVKLDGRVDRKRDLMFKLRQSLYLTPRARAGVAPKGKEKEPELDPLEKFLNDVTTDLNGENQ